MPGSSASSILMMYSSLYGPYRLYCVLSTEYILGTIMPSGQYGPSSTSTSLLLSTGRSTLQVAVASDSLFRVPNPKNRYHILPRYGAVKLWSRRAHTECPILASSWSSHAGVLCTGPRREELTASSIAERALALTYLQSSLRL